MTEIMQNKWQNGEFGCFSDIGNCCFGYCCPLCMICSNAKALGKMEPDKPPLYCLIACCFPVLGIFLLRNTAREKYGIEGDTINDAICSVCCAACVNCQTASEVKARGGAAPAEE